MLSRTIFINLVVMLLGCSFLFSSGQNSEELPDLKTFLQTEQARKDLFNITRSRETFNKVDLLHMGKRSIVVREKIIRDAKEYIFMSVPYWHADEAGMKYIDTIDEKRRNNPLLDMRLILGFANADFFAQFMPSFKYKLLRSVFNDKVLQWNALWWLRSFSYNLMKYRLHDKMLIVDGRKMVMGGLNVGNHYFHGGCSSYGWHDTDIYLEGPVVQEASKIFIKNWELMKRFKSSKYFPPYKREWIPLIQDYFFKDKVKWEYWVTPERRPARPPFMQKKIVWFPIKKYLLSRKYFPKFEKKFDTSVRLIYDNPFSDRSRKRPYKPYSKTQKALRYLMKRTKSYVKMFVPYFTANQEFLEIIMETARRGVKVEIITNSINSLDTTRIYYGSLYHYLPLIRSDVKIYEWQGHREIRKFAEKHKISIENWPGHTLHTKAVIFDGQVAMIGSHNMNVRSDHYNTEVMALINSEEFATDLETIFDHDLKPYMFRLIEEDKTAVYSFPKVRPITEKNLKEALIKYAPEVRFYKWLQKFL